MATHEVELRVKVVMDEMDGTAEQSAEIADTLVYEAISKHWDAGAEVEVVSFSEREE